MKTGCMLCPRRCGVDRSKQTGFCGAPDLPRVAKVMLHPWEEPCICQGNGAGAIFFSGCALRCVFCQNHVISQSVVGREKTENDLIRVFFDLEEQGASCLDLVSPTPYLDTLIPALKEARENGFSLPVVYNTGGYESVESLQRLEGLVDIYLPDLKYRDHALSAKYSGAKDYFDRAFPALLEMHRQTGNPSFQQEKLLRGVIVRHLILPGLWRDSVDLMHALFNAFGKSGVVLSLMRQYLPCYKAKEYPEIDRRLTTLEYEKVLSFVESLGFRWVYTQARESASDSYIPDFFDKSPVAP